MKATFLHPLPYSALDYSSDDFIGHAIKSYRVFEKETGQNKNPNKKHLLTEEERERYARIRHEYQKSTRKKLTGIFGLIHDSLTLSSRILLVNVVLKLPTLEEVNNLLKNVSSTLTPTEMTKLKKLGNSNEAIEIFRYNLERMFKREDTPRRKSGQRIYPPHVFIAWVREYGTKLGRRHYHVLIGLNGHREYTAGPYHGLPMCQHNFSRRIAWCWLETLGLDNYEFVNSTSIGREKRSKEDVEMIDKETGEISNRSENGDSHLTSLFGWLVYYPGKKAGRRVSEGSIYKSCMLYRNIAASGMRWIYKVVSYMLKKETKEIPEDKRGEVKKTERTFGCSRRFVL